MHQTISDLWYGNIAPCEHLGAHDPEINKLITLMERHRESLRREISVEQNETLKKYIDCSDEYALLMMERAFCDGFCTAAKLMTDALHS